MMEKLDSSRIQRLNELNQQGENLLNSNVHNQLLNNPNIPGPFPSSEPEINTINSNSNVNNNGSDANSTMPSATDVPNNDNLYKQFFEKWSIEQDKRLKTMKRGMEDYKEEEEEDDEEEEQDDDEEEDDDGGDEYEEGEYEEEEYEDDDEDDEEEEYEDDDEDEENYSNDDNEDYDEEAEDERRLEEIYKMLQLVTSRILKERLLEAYKEKKRGKEKRKKN
ncbi:unnamed protein product [[Candida] boidinii]|nr:unnamed protein product [[Candida] boidinii]